MIRIVDSENRQPVELSKDGKAVFKLLGVVVADNPSKLKHLLREYGIAISKNATNLELIDAIVSLLGEQDEQFNQDLSEIFAEQIISDDYDSFNSNDLFEMDSQYDNFKVFRAVPHYLKKTFKKMGNWLKGSKKAKAQAKGESAKGMVQFQVSKDLKEKSKGKKAKIIKIAAIVGAVTAVTAFVVWRVKKSKSN